MMQKIDGFLDIVFCSQIMVDCEKGDKSYEIFKPFLEKLKNNVGENSYEELEEIFSDCCSMTATYYGIEGMKLAMEIMEGTYVQRG